MNGRESTGVENSIIKKVLSTTPLLNFSFIQQIILFSHLSQLLKILLLRGSVIMKLSSWGFFNAKKAKVQLLIIKEYKQESKLLN